VATAWTLAFEDPQQATPGAAGLLRLLAFCAPEAVPLRLLLRPREGPTEPSGLAHHCAHYPNRPPILSGSRASMSADETDSAALSTSTGMLPDQHG
jgi:hypothetical protein